MRRRATLLFLTALAGSILSPAATAQGDAGTAGGMLPGKHHEELAGLEGQWTATIKQWIAPGADPLVMTGKTTYERVFGGRYLIQRMQADAMGMPYEGMGIQGYDNVSGKHTFVWIDSMGTSIIQGEGTCSEGGKVQTYIAKVTVGGGEQTVKLISRILSAERHVFTFFVVDDGGAEFKQLEVTYDRAG